MLVLGLVGVVRAALALAALGRRVPALATARRFESMADALRGADAFIGLSVGGVVTADGSVASNWTFSASGLYQLPLGLAVSGAIAGRQGGTP